MLVFFGFFCIKVCLSCRWWSHVSRLLIPFLSTEQMFKTKNKSSLHSRTVIIEGHRFGLQIGRDTHPPPWHEEEVTKGAVKNCDGAFFFFII